MSPVSSVARLPAENGDLVTHFQHQIFLPADAIQHGGIVAFELPVDDLAFVVLDVQIKVAVWIGQFHSRDGSSQRYRFVCVVLRSKGMMRQ